MSSKRHSILPPVSSSGPKPPVHFSSSITIADSALLTGTHPIAIHSESVVHPRAKLDSLAGRITIGRRCIIHERSTLGAVGTSGKITEAAVTLGDYVTVEVGAAIEAGETVIGEGTVVGVGARVGAGAVVGKHCTLTPHSEIAAGEVVPDLTVVYSNGMRRTDKREVAELKNKGIARQIDVLRRMIPSNPAKFA
ncbi:trimeric LpxA-like protein [Parathielavia appendiculata]|uniref:Dynactin subunit 6 n=1 Tax=Parathielavia appendiculata TaxID=2587402 RepID=A0AAN6U6C0_9PEZI|nr:trimeric LpxA-like protein [Parathielavia appendiculata]